MALGTTFANGLLDWIFRAGSAPTLDAELSFSLHTDDPGGDGSNEVGSGGEYTRVDVTRGTGEFADASNKATSNTNAITFPDADPDYSGDGSPVTVTHLGVWSDTTFLFGLPLTTPRTITAGQTNIRIAAGDFDPSLT